MATDKKVVLSTLVTHKLKKALAKEHAHTKVPITAIVERALWRYLESQEVTQR